MLKAIAQIGGLQIVVALIFVARVKGTAEFLGPAGIGVVSIIDQYAQLVLQLSAFSLPFAAVRYLSRSHSRGHDAFQEMYATLFQFLVFATGIGTSIALLVSYFRPGWLDSSLTANITLLTLALAAVPAMALHAFFRNALAAAQRPKRAAVFDAAVAATITASILGGIAVRNVQGYFIGQLLASVVISVSAALYLNRSLGLAVGARVATMRRQIREHADLFEFSLVMYAVSFIAPLSLLIARIVVFDRFGAVHAGWLQAAIGLSLAINMMLNPLNGLLLTPVVNRDIPVEEKLVATLEFQRKLLFTIGVVVTPVIVFADLFIRILYTSEFLPAADVLYLFVIGQVLMQISGVYGALIIGLNHIRVFGFVAFTGQIVLGVVAWYGAPVWGLAGVGLAMLLSGLVVCILSIGFVVRCTGLSLEPRIIYGAATLVVLMFFMGYLATDHDSLTPTVFAIKTISYIALSGTLFFVCFDRPERRAFWHRAKSMVFPAL